MSGNHISKSEKSGCRKEKGIITKLGNSLQKFMGNGVDHTLNNSNSFFGINS